MRLPTRPRRGPCALACLFLLAAASALPCRAQSGDVNFPTPVYSNVVAGRIAPRDVGDPRRTRHFYAFRGTEGDLVVRLVGTNLNGSVDVFAARTMRPLMTITLIGGSATDATKTVYLREEELLVLRVEARSVGDRDGSYSITLGGSFAPAPAGLAEAPAAPALPEVSSGERRAGTRRVTSTGARIDEPPPAAPAPTPAEARAETPPPAAVEGEAAEAAPPARRTNTRRGARPGANAARNRNRTRPGSRPAAEAAPEAAPAAPAPEAGDRSAGEAAERPAGEAGAPARPTRRGRNRGTRANRRAAGEGAATGAGPEAAAGATTTAAPPAAAPQRLVITTRGGETIEHDMSAVRRMSVENNQLVVTTRDGRTVRRPMTDVLRVSIEPAPQP